MHKYLQQRSSEASAAQLFFIPIYTGRYYHALLVSEGLSHQDSLSKTSQLVVEVIDWVKANFHYWNLTNGFNHFMVYPMDHGRCHSLAGLRNDEFGDLFAIQQTGDMLMRDFETRSWRCYQPGRDVLMPTMTEDHLSLDKIIRPDSKERPISVLYRFSGGGRGVYGNLRSNLLQAHHDNAIYNSTAGWASATQTHADMSNSIFCVCPPGISQHTLRVYRSIIFGCIPVTFLLANDSPYEKILGINYREFTVNINPDEWHLTRRILSSLLAQPETLRRMQAALTRVQGHFVWDHTEMQGVYSALYQELQLHPARYL